MVRIRTIALLAATLLPLLAPASKAQDGTQPPLPLATQAGELAPVIDPAWELLKAGEALRVGFARQAADIATAVLREASTLPAVRLEAARIASLGALAAEDATGAAAILNEWPGERDNSWTLRQALLEVLTGNLSAAAQRTASLNPQGLDPTEVPWVSFLQGVAAEARGDIEAAQAAHAAAAAAATTPGMRARIELRRLRVLVANATPDEQTLTQLRERVANFTGRQVGWQAAQQLAQALLKLGRSAEAVQVLEAQLLELPPEDPGARDRCRLLIGLADGPAGTRGRPQLLSLLADGTSAEWQLTALQLLLGSANGAAALRPQLDRLIELNPPHRIRPELVLARADIAIADAAFVEAGDLLQKLLSSTLTPELRRRALLRLAVVAWRQSRFLTAAGTLAELRGLALTDLERNRLGVLQGDALARARDFAAAADAYSVAWGEGPEPTLRGAVLFQWVSSELRAGRQDRALAALDRAATDPLVDPASRWRAEWNTLSTLRAAGRLADAELRLNTLLSPENAAAIPVELRIRFQWLRSELALQSSRPAEAIILSSDLLRVLSTEEAAVLPENERKRLQGAARLIEAEATILSRTFGEGRERLEQLRADLPNSEAAQQSYLIEARQMAEVGDEAGARAALTRLLDLYPDSEYTVQALYEIALLAERRGGANDLDAGIERLEQLARHPAAGGLLFYARLKQGDLLRKRDNFTAARSVYESVLNDTRFTAHPQRPAVEVALADSLLAESMDSDASFATATGLLERVFDTVDNPPDLRMEAAVKLASAFVARERAARAEELFLAAWTRFGESVPAFTPAGRYWLGRLCLSWAEWLERRGRPADARLVYERLAALDVPGRQVAEARLRRAGGQ